jgi:hypothetical protein
LPQIQTELENTIQKTRAGLQKLPKPPSSDPVGEIASLLHQFIGDLDNVLEGVSYSDGLLQAIRPAQERFRREIRDTAPDFQPFEEGEANSGSEFEKAEPAFLVNEDGPTFNIPMAELGSATSLIFIDGVLERAHRYVRSRHCRCALSDSLPGPAPVNFLDNIPSSCRNRSSRNSQSSGKRQHRCFVASSTARSHSMSRPSSLITSRRLARAGWSNV